MYGRLLRRMRLLKNHDARFAVVRPGQCPTVRAARPGPGPGLLRIEVFAVDDTGAVRLVGGR